MSQFENIMRECLKDFRIGDKGQFCGYCVSEEELEDLFTRLQCVGYSYSVRSSAHRRQSPDSTSSTPRMLFQLLQGEIDIPFFGLPFMIEYSSYRQCTLGPKYYDKEEFDIPEHLADHFIPKKKRKLLIETKKSDCPATFSVKCVRIFPGNVVKSPNDRKIKRHVIDSLKHQMLFPNKPKSYLRFYVAASPPDRHTHSEARMKASGDLHPRLVLEIKKHVKNGITSIREIKLLLERFVETTFTGTLRPDRVNTKFYPTHRTIYNHVYKIRKAIFDQESLETQVDDEYDYGIRRSDCNTETNCVRYDVQDSSYSDESNEEQIIPEKSGPYPSLYEEARDICKRIMTLTYNCNHETIKKLVDDLKNVQRSVELSLSAGGV